MAKNFQNGNWKPFLLWFPVFGYILCGIAVLPLQVMAFIFIKPCSLWMYRKTSYYFSLIMYWHLTFLVLWWSNTSIEIFMDTKDLSENIGREHSIFLANHKYEHETFMIMGVCEYFKILGNLRCFSKKDLKYLPVVGWLWKLQEHIFMDRNFNIYKAIMEKNLKSLMKHSDAVTIILFPEGTRFTEEKHKASMLVARKKGLQELKHHLLPRTKGFVTCINTCTKKGNHFGLPIVVYDALFVMESKDGKSNVFSILDLLRGYGPNVKLLLRRYPVDSIPGGETESAKWLHNLYQEKDEYMENCLQSGNFAGKQDDKNVKCSLIGFNSIMVPKPIRVLIFIVSWDAACCLGMLWRIICVLENGDILQIIAFLFITIILTILFRILNNYTKTETGSSYGRISKRLSE